MRLSSSEPARGRRVVVLGGGLAGMAVALGLAEAGWTNIVILERGASLGGLAGSFDHDGRSYPLGYHHILPGDRTLMTFLDLVGVRDRIGWRRVRMLFEAPSGLYDLARVRDFARFPLPLMSKLRFARLMLYAYGKHDWTDWSQRSGDELIDAHADRDVRRVLFEPLVQLKFRRSCAEISGEWIGVRLSYREGAAPLGFIGDANWTTLLCQGLERLLRERGVEIRTEAVAHQLVVQESAASQVLLANGERLDADLFVSTVPTTVYRAICPCDQTPQLKTIEYTALLSMVCATREPPPRDFYWLNLATRRHAACGLFNLSSLNPTIGHRGETCLNFVTHLPETNAEYRRSEDEIVAAYLADYRRLFGRTLRPTWVKVSRIPIYSPVFVKGYAPPPPRSVTAGNVYFAGNYAGAPTIASTGSALQSGLDAARAILRDAGTPADAFPAILRE